ncbi:MAG: hypothetical protein ACI9R3_003917 [Verrucomicrobiales bacterium]|jgi:hypothetical protein
MVWLGLHLGMTISRLPLHFLFSAALFLTSCSSVYFGALEKVGVHKRDLMIKRVLKARDAQEEAKEQFQTTLQQFSQVTGFDGGKLQETYETLQAAYDRSEVKAKAVKSRNDDVENVSKALFREWQAEVKTFENRDLQVNSERQLRAARQKYEQLMTAMRRAEDRIDPVLRAFRDQVLYLKHNLNARAISSMQGELRRVEIDVASLVREMERAIGEAEAFVRSME